MTQKTRSLSERSIAAKMRLALLVDGSRLITLDFPLFRACGDSLSQNVRAELCLASRTAFGRIRRDVFQIIFIRSLRQHDEARRLGNPHRAQ
jgi:hypothetical protein